MYICVRACVYITRTMDRMQKPPNDRAAARTPIFLLSSFRLCLFVVFLFIQLSLVNGSAFYIIYYYYIKSPTNVNISETRVKPLLLVASATFFTARSSKHAHAAKIAEHEDRR